MLGRPVSDVEMAAEREKQQRSAEGRCQRRQALLRK
jgi:hypothetical protein